MTNIKFSLIAAALEVHVFAYLFCISTEWRNNVVYRLMRREKMLSERRFSAYFSRASKNVEIYVYLKKA